MNRLNQTKPATFHFKFCRIGLSLRILISLYLLASLALFVPEAVKGRSYIQSRMLYCRSLKIVQHDIIIVLVYFSSFHSAIFLLGCSSSPHLNTVESPLGYVTCRMNTSVDLSSSKFNHFIYLNVEFCLSWY
jgi:hypothetical protein